MINSAEQRGDGLIAIAPSTTGEFEELLQATSSVRSLVICGDRDSRVDRYRHLESQLAERNQVEFDLIEGLGHSNPPDLDRRVDQFLAGF